MNSNPLSHNCCCTVLTRWLQNALHIASMGNVTMDISLARSLVRIAIDLVVLATPPPLAHLPSHRLALGHWGAIEGLLRRRRQRHGRGPLHIRGRRRPASPKRQDAHARQAEHGEHAPEENGLVAGAHAGLGERELPGALPDELVCRLLPPPRCTQPCCKAALVVRTCAETQGLQT